MRNFLKFFSILLFVSPLFAAVPQKQIQAINQFSGLNTDDDSLFLSNGQTPDSENVLTDLSKSLEPRKGYTQFSTETSKGLYVFNTSNGSHYLITQSSNVLKATLGDSNFTIFIATVDPNVFTACSALGDNLYFSNTIDGLKHWNLTTITVDSATYNFSILVTFKGRLCGAGMPSDPRTIYLSEYLNGSNFALAVYPVDTDPARIQVQGAIDESISGLYSSYNDLLMWFKSHSFGGLYGNRRSNFQSYSYSEIVGCSYADSVRDCDGVLRFLGSNKTIYEFDGTNLKPISDDIDNLIGTVAQGDLNQRSWTQTTAADWNAGTVGIGLDITTFQGDIVFISSTPSPIHFDYTGTSQSWIVPNGVSSITITLLGAVGGNNGGRNGAGGGGETYSTMTVTSGEILYIYVGGSGNGSVGGWNGGGQGGGTPSGDYVGGGGGGGATDIRVGGTSLSNRVLIAAGGGGDGGYNYYHPITGGGGSYPTVITGSGGTGGGGTGGSQISGGSLNGSLGQGGDGDHSGGFYSGGGGGGYYGGGGGRIRAEEPPSYGGITCGGGGGSGYNGLGTNAIFTYLDNTGAGSVEIDYVFDYSSVYQSTFVSQSYNVGSKITSWGTFAEDHQDNGGNIGFRIFSDTNSNIDINDPTTFISSQPIANGQIPTTSTGSYVTIVADFSRSFSTQTPTLNDFTLHWNEGSQIKVPSLYQSRRYWLGVAISSNANNKIIVYDRNSQWQKWSNMNADSMCIFNGNPLFGNVNGIYQAESGNTDNGVPIVSYFTSKEYALGSINNYKTFHYMYMTTTNNENTLSIQYLIDGYASPYSFPDYQMNQRLGYQDFKLPFSDSIPTQGKTISFKWTVNGSTLWKILNGNLYYRVSPKDSE